MVENNTIGMVVDAYYVVVAAAAGGAVDVVVDVGAVVANDNTLLVA